MKRTNSRRHGRNLRPSSKSPVFHGKKIYRFLWAIVAIFVVSCAGTILYFTSRAATPSISLEPEKGTVGLAATVADDAAASNGKAVKFGSAGNQKPLPLSQLFFGPSGNASVTAYKNETNPGYKNLYWQIAATPVAIWLGVDTNQSHFTSEVTSFITQANQQHKTPVFVLYAIPGRDCNGYSQGGFSDTASYEHWVDWFTSALGNNPALVIVEPDAVGICSSWRNGTDPNAAQKIADRWAQLKYDMDSLSSRNPNAYAYLHAGSGQLTISSMVDIWKKTDAWKGRGMAMNVSSYNTTAANVTWVNSFNAALVAAGMPHQHMVIDTSRNGTGYSNSAGSPCGPINYPGRAVGTRPTTATGNPDVDAFLWIKMPGGSDGSCGGAPAAGHWYPTYAQELVQNGLNSHTIVRLDNGVPYTGQQP